MVDNFDQMPPQSITRDQIREKLLALLPTDGSAKGNITLIREIKNELGSFPDEDYWSVQRELVNNDEIIPGRGQGGSVRRPLTVSPPIGIVSDSLRESDLYAGVHEYVRKSFVEKQRLTDFVSEITASQGRRDTGGMWTRPDIVVVGLRTFNYLPDRRVEVVTFEVKRKDNVGVEAAYEASAHLAAAHRSFIVAEASRGSDLDERLVSECERLGVGIISFEQSSNLESYYIYVNGRVNSPDLDKVDQMIDTQLTPASRDIIRRRFR
ncbi:MAG TPA: hypothetical protein VHZ07_26030 [Bryobacteraceae bacterium]|jgi:hypothetical protein|nr:hypothetical protein [Bryobacteraceae bacterium]